MIEKVRKINTKYKIYQYSKDNELIKIWNCVNDIIKENPNFKKHNIYAVLVEKNHLCMVING